MRRASCSKRTPTATKVAQQECRPAALPLAQVLGAAHQEEPAAQHQHRFGWPPRWEESEDEEEGEEHVAEGPEEVRELRARRGAPT